MHPSGYQDDIQDLDFTCFNHSHDFPKKLWRHDLHTYVIHPF